MPYHFVRRAGVLALAATMVVPQAGALSDVSSWAQEDIAAAQQAGLMPTSLADSSAREEITRAEFCAIAVKAYKQLTGKAVYIRGTYFSGTVAAEVADAQVVSDQVDNIRLLRLVTLGFLFRRIATSYQKDRTWKIR